MPDTNGRYRIQVVAELTAVPAPTLRAWERRYGIPTPARTAAAYRLYSDSDVAMVKRLRDLCAKGISIAEAAQVVKSSIEGAATLDSANADPYSVATRRIVDAIVAFDARAVEREAARAQYLGPATAVFEQVYSPVMRRVGELCRAGTLSFAQERIAATTIEDLVRAVVRLVNPDDSPSTVVLACFPEEDQALPVHGVALRLASWGITTVTLGNRTPPDAVADIVRTLRPSAVGLSTTVAPDPAKARSQLEAFARAIGNTPWFITGAGVSASADIARDLGAKVIDGEFADARPILEHLVRSSSAIRDEADIEDGSERSASGRSMAS